MNGDLPQITCRRWTAAGWPEHEPVALRDTVTGAAPQQTTHVQVAWDDALWRLRFEAQDALPWATITQRDGELWTEEALEVFCDPVGDLAGYCEVEINPLGTVTDLYLRRIVSGWRKDFSWSVDGLAASAQLTPAGWSAELAIPFTSLASDRPQPGAEWRVNFLRIDRPGGAGTEAELSAWSPTGLRNFHRAARFGRMTFAA